MGERFHFLVLLQLDLTSYQFLWLPVTSNHINSNTTLGAFQTHLWAPFSPRSCKFFFMTSHPVLLGGLVDKAEGVSEGTGGNKNALDYPCPQHTLWSKRRARVQVQISLSRVLTHPLTHTYPSRWGWKKQTFCINSGPQSLKNIKDFLGCIQCHSLS